jgi:D-cysteine desulfhydrase
MRLSRLEAALGPGVGIYCKHDGAYGSAYGGNKTRKLEYLLADAQRRGKRDVVTFGGTGTNHGLATAIHARALGMATSLVLVDQPETQAVQRQLTRFARLGVDVHRAHGTVGAALALPGVIVRRRPYLIWVGGSSPRGTVGIVDAGLELAAQVRAGELPPPSDVVVALGSGGTAAGLLLGLGLAGLESRVTAVLVADQLPLPRTVVLRLVRRTAKLMRAHGREVPAHVLAQAGARLRVVSDFLGGGYGHNTPAAERAVALSREHEGLELEGVYTGKTMAALAALRSQGGFAPGPVLYWHTHNSVPLGEVDR